MTEYILEFLSLSNLSYYELIWVCIGTFGQLIFFSRWLVQLYYSEKNKSSIIPIGFWWLSLIGGVITFIYAKHIDSFPFMLAQGVGIIVYSRNLYLLHRKK